VIWFEALLFHLEARLSPANPVAAFAILSESLRKMRSRNPRCFHHVQKAPEWGCLIWDGDRDDDSSDHDDDDDF
jgi:hypothetical protein